MIVAGDFATGDVYCIVAIPADTFVADCSVAESLFAGDAHRALVATADDLVLACIAM